MTASLVKTIAEPIGVLYTVDTDTAVAVTTSGVTIGTLLLEGMNEFGFTVSVTSGNTMSGFTMQLQDHENSTAYDLISDTDWTMLAGTYLLPRISTLKPNNLDNGEASNFELKLPPAYSMTFNATSGSGVAVKLQGTGRRI